VFSKHSKSGLFGGLKVERVFLGYGNINKTVNKAYQEVFEETKPKPK